MEIACVIPAFESPALFAGALASAAGQRDVDLEIVVSDDSRPGAEVATLAAGDRRVRYLEGPRSGNPVDNWNAGLAAARSPVRVLLHHDEAFADPLYLRRALDLLAASGAVAVNGGTVVEGRDRRSGFARARRLGLALGAPAWLLPRLNWIGPTAAFVFVGDRRFDPRLAWLADVEFYRRVLAGGRLALLGGVCVRSLGHHGAQISARIDKRAAARRERALMKGSSLAAPIGGR